MIFVNGPNVNCKCNANLSSVCSDGVVRLVGGNSNNEGRLEVCTNRRWGTVCSNDQEEIAEAACSRLGLPVLGMS